MKATINWLKELPRLYGANENIVEDIIRNIEEIKEDADIGKAVKFHEAGDKICDYNKQGNYV